MEHLYLTPSQDVFIYIQMVGSGMMEETDVPGENVDIKQIPTFSH